MALAPPLTQDPELKAVLPTGHAMVFTLAAALNRALVAIRVAERTLVWGTERVLPLIHVAELIPAKGLARVRESDRVLELTLEWEKGRARV